MNRRSFIKSLGAGLVAIPLLPVLRSTALESVESCTCEDSRCTVEWRDTGKSWSHLRDKVMTRAVTTGARCQKCGTLRPLSVQQMVYYNQTWDMTPEESQSTSGERWDIIEYLLGPKPIYRMA